MTCCNVSVDVTTPPDSQPLIDDKTADAIVLALMTVAGPVMSSIGIVTNAFTTAVYTRQGIRDSVTVLFITLSISYCALSILGLASSTSIIARQLTRYRPNKDLFSINYLLIQAREKTYSISLMTVFVMSVERCFCVAFPFTVKQNFTKSRSVKTAACVSLICAAFLIPDYIILGFTWTDDRNYNSTEPSVWTSLGTATFNVFKNTILAVLFPFLAGVAASISAVYITSAVKASNKFRQSSTASNNRVKSVKTVGAQKSGPTVTATKRLSRRDIRLTRTVITVLIILAICNVPKCIALTTSIIALYIPEFTATVPSKYQNLVSILLISCYTFEAINGSSNFFVFYHFSSQFRTDFKSIFCSNLNAD